MTTWAEERKSLADAWFKAASLGIAETYVYRYFDADGRLLYVGQSAHPDPRHKNHRNSKAWFSEVATRSLEGPYTKDCALALEWWALQTENPEHNKSLANGYRGPHSLAWQVADSEEYARRKAADPDYDSEAMRLALDRFGALLTRHAPVSA